MPLLPYTTGPVYVYVREGDEYSFVGACDPSELEDELADVKQTAYCRLPFCDTPQNPRYIVFPYPKEQ